jgi:hypothetical protein
MATTAEPDDATFAEAHSVFQLTLVSATLVLSIVTMTVNPITLIAMLKHKLITKSSINLFIASLCCSDLILGISAFFFQLQQLLKLAEAS